MWPSIFFVANRAAFSGIAKYRNVDEDNTDSCINAAAFQNIADEVIEMAIQNEFEAANKNQCSVLNIFSIPFSFTKYI